MSVYLLLKLKYFLRKDKKDKKIKIYLFWFKTLNYIMKKTKNIEISSIMISEIR